MIKVSIITITYNSAKTLQRTIDSVLNQTYNNFEYIIVDGNSKDNTVDIIKRNEGRFAGKICWKSEPDTGIYNAMNKGLKMATGQIVGLINSDDWLEPTAFETVVGAYKNNSDSQRDNTLICGAIRYHYDENDIQYFGVNSDFFYDSIKEKKLRGAWHPGTYVPKAVYDRVGLFDETFRIVGDVDFIYRCYIDKCGFVFLKEVLSNMADGGASTQKNSYHLSDSIYMMKKYGNTSIIDYMLLYIGVAKTFVRYHMPLSIIKLYRRRYNN